MTFIDRRDVVRALSGLASDGSCFSFRDAVCSHQSFEYENLSFRIDQTSRIGWCLMRPRGRPSYTHDLMRDLTALQDDIADLFAYCLSSGRDRPMDWFVMASDVPGIFNLGGDLDHFAEKIRAHDLAALKHYGRVAVEGVYRNSIAFNLPLVTIALLQGDALGGGFEHALSFDLIIAERSAKLGLPEILFNLFPGMGAYSFLSRRLDRARAEALLLSGRIYTAEELHSMGVVDVVAADGRGEEAVLDYVGRFARKQNALYNILRARRRVNPVTLEELRDVVDIWAEAALNLTESDLRKMARLVTAQDRRLAACRPGSGTAECPIS